MLFGCQRKVLESQIAEGKISGPEGRRNTMSRRALEQRVPNKATRSPGESLDAIATQDLDEERNDQGYVLPAYHEYEEHLLGIQQEMEDSDEEDGTPFDATTKLYEEYKLTEGSTADRWAREVNSKLQFNWREHPTTLSNYSHGDCGALGLMEKNLGMEPAQRQPAFAQTEAIPTQDWERARISPVGGDEDFEMPPNRLELLLW